MKTERMDIDIEGLKRGETAAVSGLLEHFGRRSFRIACQYTGNRDDASDIVQETVVKILDRISTFNGKMPFSSWYFKVLTNHCRDWKRNAFRRLRRPLSTAEESVFCRPAVEQERREWLWRAIHRMPSKMKMIFILHYQEEFPVAQVAEVMDISEDTVRVQLFRGRRHLREKLEKTEELKI